MDTLPARLDRSTYNQICERAESEGTSPEEKAGELLKKGLRATDEIEVRSRPVPVEEQRAMLEDGQIHGVYQVPLGTLTQDLESVLDDLSRRLVGHLCLQGVDYEAVGARDGDVLLRIRGYLEEDQLQERS